jgi:hypothetical protein
LRRRSNTIIRRPGAADPSYAKRARELADKHGALLIVDGSRRIPPARDCG